MRPLSATHVALELQSASSMPSRPTTPAGISDTSSDPGSLSDLESGWTDLSSNRSISGGQRSVSAASDPGDNEGDRSAIDIYEGEAWEGLTPEASELNIGEGTPSVESPPTAHPLHSPSPQQAMSDLALEDWVADALGSSLISDSISLELSTPHVSIRGSQALRLAFPDPLSNSEDNILPSHVLSRPHSLSTEAASEVEVGGDRSTHTQTLSSLTSTFTRSLPSDHSLSIPDDDSSYQDQPKRNYQLRSLEHTPSSPVSYALSVVLLGHPPLPHFKSMTVSTLMDMVAFVFKGSPDIPKGSGSTSIYEVPIQAHRRENCNMQPDVSTTHHVLISDHTSGSSSFMGFDAPDCPTVALVFIQPPLSSPSIPRLPMNTRYLPLLLPSISDGFTSSLLDLSPSVLFDHSVPNITTPDHDSSKSFALQQCVEMNILDKRLEGSGDVLGLDEFTTLPAQQLSTVLAELMFSEVDESEDVSEEKESPTGTSDTHRFSALHKQNMIISAFFVALLFGSTVLLRGTLSNTPVSPQTTPSLQSQRLWSFFNPFGEPASSAVPAAPPPSPVSTELPPRSRALMPASLKSLAVSVFLPESVPENAAGPSTVVDPSSDKYEETEGRGSATWGSHEHHRISVASLDAADRPLTLDAPCSKLLPMLPPTRSSASNGKGKKAIDVALASPTPFLGCWNSVSNRVSDALSPFFNAANHDLRELQDAIDALLHALLQLQGIASQGISDVVQVLSKQAEQGVQDFASKVYSAASHRHARARYNAKKVRDVGERYVGAARQMLEAGFERARGNAKEVLTEGLSMRKIASQAKRQFREESRKLKRQAKEHRKSARIEAKTKRAECRQKQSRRAECMFQTVVAYMA